MKAMGMMSGCYFVGRGELLQWLNELLQISYSKVEQTSNGAAFCQILDAIHPGTVALSRVNYNATQGFEMTQNYRVFQDSLRKNGIKQYVDVMTLTKGKYMAALELLQWIHGYYDQTGPHDPYDAVERRNATGCAGPVPQSEDSAKKCSGFPTSKPLIPIKGKDPTIGKVGQRNVPKQNVRSSRNIKENSAEGEQLRDLQEKCESLQRRLQLAEEYCQKYEDSDLIQPLLEIFRSE
jgi:RP/EB family microtubule-associated protein